MGVLGALIRCTTSCIRDSFHAVNGDSYLKDSKTYFIYDTLDFFGLEAGPNGLWPSLKKRETMLGWPTPVSQEEVNLFCYLTPFLQRFLPGRAELVLILKYGLTGKEQPRSKEEKKGVRRAPEQGFNWNREKEVAFQAIKQAIVNNAMAPPDPSGQYHLAVDASKRGMGGVLFQLEGILPGTEAGNNPNHQSAERIIMFMYFRLSDVETRY